MTGRRGKRSGGLGVGPRPARAVLVVVALAVAAAGCAGSAASTDGAPATPQGAITADPSGRVAGRATSGTDTSVTGATAIPGGTGPAAAAPGTATVPPATVPPATAPPFTPTTTAPEEPPAIPAAASCTGRPPVAPAGGLDPAAAAAATATLAPALADLRTTAGGQVSVSVSVDGLGEVAAADPAALLVPASNQKLLVAVAVLESLPADDRLATTVVATGPVTDGRLDGDLVLVGGGDPRLTRTALQSLDSLDALAGQVRAQGITTVDGRLLVDESRYDVVRAGPSWPGGGQGNIGPLSALVVDRNRTASDAGFATDPALGNAGFFRDALTAAGVTVTGATAHGSAPTGGTQVAETTSPPLRQLVAEMLTMSDNLVAEVLVKELGHRRSGIGTSAAGLTAARDVLAGLCIAVDGSDADGSGLSADDRRSPAAWRRLLDGIRTRPWWPILRDGLPVAGRSGTLVSRLTGPATAGNLRAKSGSVALSRALSGYVTTTGGRLAVFSIVVNHPGPQAEKAIDAFATAVAELP